MNNEGKKVKKIIAIACSTGGPKALQVIVPFINSKINCPVVIVQHMPNGFTKTLAQRLDLICELPVSEGIDKEILEDNHIYIAKAGYHLKIEPHKKGNRIVYCEGESRNGVKPCANYMFESLAECDYDEIICVVLTGMGSDGTEGINYLLSKKKVKVLVQDEESSVVFGMPGSIIKSKIECSICELSELGKVIVDSAEG